MSTTNRHARTLQHTMSIAIAIGKAFYSIKKGPIIMIPTSITSAQMRAIRTKIELYELIPTYIHKAMPNNIDNTPMAK